MRWRELERNIMQPNGRQNIGERELGRTGRAAIDRCQRRGDRHFRVSIVMEGEKYRLTARHLREQADLQLDRAISEQFRKIADRYDEFAEQVEATARRSDWRSSLPRSATVFAQDAARIVPKLEPVPRGALGIQRPRENDGVAIRLGFEFLFCRDAAVGLQENTAISMHEPNPVSERWSVPPKHETRKSCIGDRRLARAPPRRDEKGGSRSGAAKDAADCAHVVLRTELDPF